MFMVKLLLALACLQAGIVNAQMRISLRSKGRSLYDVIQSLKMYTKGEIIPYECFRYTKPVFCELVNVTLDSALKVVFKDQPLCYELKHDYLTVFPGPVKGRAIDENGNGMEGIIVQSADTSVITDNRGYFELPRATCDSTIQFTSMNIEPHTAIVHGRMWIEVSVKIKWIPLDEKTIINDGIQKKPKERATGAFYIFPEREYKRQVFTNSFDAFEARLPGVSFNKNLLSWKNQAPLNIRMSATMNAATSPLIVINNFPVVSSLELDALNQLDIMSITVLKDAAATSIWGARAGNGVIVIATKNGNYKRPMKVSVSNSLTVGTKTDVRYMPTLTSTEYIDMETARYVAGYYDNILKNPSKMISPVVAILHSNNTQEQKELLLKELRKRDVRNDVDNLFYRSPVTHRHFVNITGGYENVNYYLSTGYDEEQLSLVTASRKRFTSSADIRLKKKKLEIGMNNFFSYELKKNINAVPTGLYPFSQLQDSTGLPATVFATINQHFKDSMNQYLQSWDYRPLQELYARDLRNTNLTYRLGLTTSYSIMNGLDLNLLYQHDQGTSETDDVNSASSYAARNLQNSFAKVQNGSAEYILPQGGIMNWQSMEYRADRIRTQLNYKSQWKDFELVALAGFESSAFQMDSTSFIYYGYFGDKRKPALNYSSIYTLSYDSNSNMNIPQKDRTSSIFDGFVSYYSNAAINYKNRYTVSFSARLDRSNLFGANTNKKTVPLWSVGGKWDASKEKFYPFKGAVPSLSFHSSWGISGNVDKFTTAFISAVPSETAQGTVYSIINPANRNLTWEKSRMFNLGFSISDNNSRYNLSFDYFRRKSFDLLGPGELDPVTGASFLWGNFAEMKGKGYEADLKTDHNIGAFRLVNRLLISHSTNTVTNYNNSIEEAGYFVDNGFLRPREGLPVYPILAFKWAGLERTTGDPLGYLNKLESKDYNSIIAAPAESLVNKGSSLPTIYGTMQPQLTWRNWKLSFTLFGKFGYYFRRSSVNYSDPYTVTLMGKNDYSNRWQKEGQSTNVPSRQIAGPTERDLFYTFSEALVEKGDHIRLKDVRLEFDCSKIIPKAWKIRSVTSYIYAANLGLIWSANKMKIDPDFLQGPPVSKSITTGFSLEF